MKFASAGELRSGTDPRGRRALATDNKTRLSFECERVSAKRGSDFGVFDIIRP
jgi:hypothetical protein